MKKHISVHGARVHNLDNVSLDIPKDALVVFTGLSGSGKSSLAFDTIYAEGQRRYVESLSAYARQFLAQLDKPDVDAIEGLSPAISIDQKNASHNPRSTVGTVTEIQDYLRLLFANIGILHCPVSGEPVRKQSVQEMATEIKTLKPNKPILILAPLIKEQKGEFHVLFNQLRKQGFVRVVVDGELKRLEDCTRLAKQKKHTIELVIDRVNNTTDNYPRLFEAIELASKQSEGLVKVQCPDTGESETYSENFVSDHYQFNITELTPRLFSFNSPLGACPDCNGLGETMYFDPDQLFPKDETVSVALDSHINFHSSNYAIRFYADAERLDLTIDLNAPIKDLSEEELTFIYYGRYGEEIDVNQKSKSRFGWKFRPRGWEGVINLLRRRYAQTESDKAKDQYQKIMIKKVCANCQGGRLNTEALCVKIGKQSIADIGSLTIHDAKKWIDTLKLSAFEETVSAQLRKEISERLTFLDAVGLHYLSLSRKANTLSGGEHQRIRLATQIGSGLTGVLYVLDEPSIGLHQRDNEQLIATLKRLRDLGNTVIVVEHDEDTMREADHVVDIGPHAGRLGGKIIHNGDFKSLLKNKDSITAQYLNKTKTMPVPKKHRTAKDGQELLLSGASGNNLKSVTVGFPLGTLICVTGVSGSGKSTLINHTLRPALINQISRQLLPSAPFKDISNFQNIDAVISINQSPIGRTPRSNPATYVGFFSAIRELFASLPESKINGFKPGRFSFNVKGGRCETCQGAGVVKIEMHFLTDIFVKCSTCKGQRFNHQTLRVEYKGHTINDVLNMTINHAAEVFENIPAIYPKLVVLQEVGLGYITLGQSATTLSGGEAQRIKLAKELSRRNNGQTLYLLDEPTTGLHFDDIHRLLNVLQRLVDQGNSMIVIEHNLDVIRCADHIIDMGPGGGDAGGRVIAKGTPADIVKAKKSATGKYLAKVLE
jgi:excinuclease ABC subunit A